MKLRNKKTGEIEDGYGVIRICDGVTNICYTSLVELNAEWEDYTPQEPIIKDEKIRKAVRAFAGLQDSKTISFEKTYSDISVIARADNGYAMMWLCDKSGLENIEYRKNYTITELCGEEEE